MPKKLWPSRAFLPKSWSQNKVEPSFGLDPTVVSGKKLNKYHCSLLRKVTCIELNIWSRALLPEEMVKLTNSCSHAAPIPDVLNWSFHRQHLLQSNPNTTKETDINQLCHNGNERIENNLVISVKVDYDSAFLVCKILQGYLTYPKNLTGFQGYEGTI